MSIKGVKFTSGTRPWDINMYIVLAPRACGAKHLAVKIEAAQLTIGLKGNPPFIDEPFHLTINSSEHVDFGDGVLLSLTKASKGQTWDCLLKGHCLWALTHSRRYRVLMLERFQAENPEFDFSGASFNGAVPDPKTFMGGVGYNTGS